MHLRELPYRATTSQACTWLAQQTGTPWSLARLIAHRLTPSIWIEGDCAGESVVDDASGGYAMPLSIEGDAGMLGCAEDVLLIISEDGASRAQPGSNVGSSVGSNAGRTVSSQLRFLKKDLERLAGRLARNATA